MPLPPAPAVEPQEHTVVRPPPAAVVVLPPTGADAAVQLFPLVPVAPVAATPDVIATRLKVTLIDEFTNTAMLD
jgi:hypothetical protein